MPMEQMLREAMLRQIAEQCVAAMMAVQLLNAALGMLEEERVQRQQQGTMPDPQQTETTRNQLWFSSHALLNAAANVSKHLWPARRKRQDVQNAFPDRGKELRAILGVDHDSPLNSRDVRNDFEHADERLEEWWLDDANHNLATRTIGPIGMEWSNVPGLITQHELFDPQRKAISFLDHVIELEPLAQALADLYQRASAESDPTTRHERKAAQESGDDVGNRPMPDDPPISESEPE
jgi:hypothetical protein